MKKIKLFTGEDFDGNIEYSIKSYHDLMNNSTAKFMPGGFGEMELTERQFKKLEETDGDGCPTHYLTSKGQVKSL
jgi:hypothetical protein